MASGVRASIVGILGALLFGSGWALQGLERHDTLLPTSGKKGLFAHEAPACIGPPNGSLVIGGGGLLNPAIWKRFVELAGGPEAPIVVLPTASSLADSGEFADDWPTLKALRSVGAKNVTIVHTRDRNVADTDEFVAPFKRARGVWITGGLQRRLVATYLGTRTQRALFGVLERGGVVGGTSAGATIQGEFASFPGRSLTPYEPGFGFLRKVAIDQHLLARHRENDLIHVVYEHPDLLGIGIDERTAVVVHDDCMDIMGESKVAIYDPEHRSDDDEKPYYFLLPGDRFNLRTRCGTHVEASDSK